MMIGKCSFGDLITLVETPSSMEYKGPFLNTKFLQLIFIWDIFSLNIV